ncbi:MAG: DMT family transporter [Bacillota bacterium]|nr:DMT family transporter [Bacillota bacterium]
MDSKKFFTSKINIVIFAAIATLLWGSAFPAVKIGYSIFRISGSDTASKLIFAGYRFTIAGTMVLGISLVLNKTIFPSSKKDFSRLAILGLLQTTIQYIFFYIGLSNTTGVNGSIMSSAGTFFSVIFAHFIYKNDKLSYSKIIGCIAGFIGVVIVNFENGMHFSFNFYGDGFIIISAAASAIAAIYAKEISNSINAIIVTGYQLFLGGMVLIVLGYVTGGKLANFTPNSTMLLVYLGFLSAAAFTLWTTLMKYNKVGSISIYNFLTPIFGAILSSIFLGENILEIKNAAALVLVCIGIYTVNSDVIKRVVKK